MKILGTFVLVLFLSCQFALAQDTLYVYRAGIVVTKRATSEIDSITFNRNYTAPVSGTVTDIDGNVYHSVTIGTQTWMVENLKATKYRNGDIIGTTGSVYTDLTYAVSPKYQWAFNGVESNVAVYGRLYTWYAVTDSRNIAPQGWHVASDAEWAILQSYLIANGFNYDKTTTGNKIAKSLCSTSLWNTSGVIGSPGYDLTQNNSSGFSSVPTGYRGIDGYYYIPGGGDDIWTSTENSSTLACARGCGYNCVDLGANNLNKNYGFSVRCIKDVVTVPVLSTAIPASITDSTATCGGNITSDGLSTVTARGVCWSTKPNPTIANSKTTDGTGTGLFTSSIKGLKVDSTYYVRAYATNTAGTAYGNQVSFTTSHSNLQTVTDIDGNVYHPVTIGTQTWMVENLKTTKYRNGDIIGTTSYINTDLTYAVSPEYQWAYNGVESNVPVYGRLYTWYAVTDSRSIAPQGWHVASDAEWSVLQDYLIANGFNYDNTTIGNKFAKSLCTTTLWNTSGIVGTPGYDLTQNNSSGFSVVPSGYRGLDGYYYNLGIGTNSWTSTENSSTLAYARNCGYANIGVGSNALNKNYGNPVRCIKNVATVPVLSTAILLSITDTTATCGGNITSDGLSTITARGVCWSTKTNPTTANSKTTDGTGTGTFISFIKGLKVDSTYYVRAYATNSAGTAYGNQVSFTTFHSNLQTVTDIDGNVYHSVTIGTQTWMVENLKTTKYRNGDIIGTTGSVYTDLTYAVSPKYQWAFNGVESNVSVYGRLYTWYAATDSRNIAPQGWHVASDAEWNVLQDYLIANGFNYDNTITGNKFAKSLCATTLWNTSSIVGTPSCNLAQNNSSGFSVVPAGYRGIDGYYYNLGNGTDIWLSNENSSTLAYARDCGYINIGVGTNPLNKNYGFSVRCIKDMVTVPVLSTAIPASINDSTATCGGNFRWPFHCYGPWSLLEYKA